MNKLNIPAIVCATLATSMVPALAAPPAPPTVRTRIISYTLAAGATSAPYKLPPNRAVSLTGTQLTPGFRGIGQVTLMSVPGDFLEWVGLESPSPSPSATTSGFSGTAGDHILYIDYDHAVDIRVHNSTSFIIHNSSGGPRTGTVTLTFSK